MPGTATAGQPGGQPWTLLALDQPCKALNSRRRQTTRASSRRQRARMRRGKALGGCLRSNLLPEHHVVIKTRVVRAGGAQAAARDSRLSQVAVVGPGCCLDDSHTCMYLYVYKCYLQSIAGAPKTQAAQKEAAQLPPLQAEGTGLPNTGRCIPLQHGLYRQAGPAVIVCIYCCIAPSDQTCISEMCSNSILRPDQRWSCSSESRSSVCQCLGSTRSLSGQYTP